MRNDSKVNWAPMLFGIIAAGGALLCFAFLGRAMGVNGPAAYLGPGTLPPQALLNPGVGGTLFAVLVNLVSFGLAGYLVTRLGEYGSPVAAALHGFVTFSATSLLIFYSGRGAMFVGRPGFPFGFADPGLIPGVSAQMGLAVMLGVLTGAIACSAAAYWAQESAVRDAASPARREEIAHEKAA